MHDIKGVGCGLKPEIYHETYYKYNRYTLRNSLIRDANRELGICEQLRCVYDSVYELPNGELKKQITEKLVDAFIMAKKMGDRLTYLNETYHDTTGHKGENLCVVHDRLLAKIRKERK